MLECEWKANLIPIPFRSRRNEQRNLSFVPSWLESSFSSVAKSNQGWEVAQSYQQSSVQDAVYKALSYHHHLRCTPYSLSAIFPLCLNTTCQALARSLAMIHPLIRSKSSITCLNGASGMQQELHGEHGEREWRQSWQPELLHPSLLDLALYLVRYLLLVYTAAPPNIMVQYPRRSLTLPQASSSSARSSNNKARKPALHILLFAFCFSSSNEDRRLRSDRYNFRRGQGIHSFILRYDLVVSDLTHKRLNNLHTVR